MLCVERVHERGVEGACELTLWGLWPASVDASVSDTRMQLEATLVAQARLFDSLRARSQ